MNEQKFNELAARMAALETTGRQLVADLHLIAQKTLALDAPIIDSDSDWKRPATLFELDTEKYGTIRIEQWPHALRVWIGGNLVCKIEDPPVIYSLNNSDCPF